ncbi:MAG TPA: HlyD family secretion protein [Bacteroidia bacterium]|jgi:membrane fusion protein (multidrug efflux system)|nr:HlyD family secretion protein [Bacteroidia bacterium]
MEQEVQKKKPTKLIVIILIALLVVGIAVTIFIKGAAYETSDNAQLDGDMVPIRSSVTAYIKAIRFQDNQLVKKGDTLILFDADELKAKLTQAEAALDNASANLLAVQNKASASVENATASVETVQSNQQSIVGAKVKLDKAQKDLDRVVELQKIKAATQEQYDNAQANLQIAKSDYEKTINQQQSSSSSSLGLKAQASADQNQIELAKAQIKQREAELALAKKQLSYATVLAPSNGVVTKRAIQLGQYVSTGQSLCVVIDTENYWISANFKETQLSKLKIGNEVEIELDAYPDLKLTGKIQSYSGATGAKFSLLPPDNATGNFIKITQRFPLRISIDNFPKEKATEIFPGLSAFVKVKVK